MRDVLRVLGISGSLRQGSHNGWALRACRDLAPAGLLVEVYEGLGDLPHYDDDLHARGLPPAVADLRRRIAEADALLIVTPEYNHSIPGVLKNAIDWASRPPDVPLVRKSVAILGVSAGMLGTVRAQAHLRDILVFFDATVVNKPEVFIGGSAQKFAPDGALTDEPTRAILRLMLEALQRQTLRVRTQALAESFA